jgi:hypothetical protein
MLAYRDVHLAYRRVRLHGSTHTSFDPENQN